MHWTMTLRAGRRLPAVGLMVLLSSCSTMPCGPAMPAPVPLPPAVCQVVCPPVPELIDGGLDSLRRWSFDLLTLYHDCRRLHAACTDAIAPERQEP